MTVQPVHGFFARVYLRLFLLVYACLFYSIPAGPAAEAPQIVIAVGDVHGDFDDFCLILKRAGLIGEGNHWSGGHATLIQTGDLLDRGPKEREVLDLMISLETEAVNAGGKVIALLGNHEMMNLMGDLRYLTPEIYASFATGDSDTLRKTAYQEYIKWRKDNSRIIAEAGNPLPELPEADWLAKHPVGFIEQRSAFSRNGIYGKWVRERRTVENTSGLIFLHGGIAPDLSRVKLEEINSRVHAEINLWDDLVQDLTAEKLILPFFTLSETTAAVRAALVAANKSHTRAADEQRAKLAPFLQLGSWLSVSSDGPLWFRGYDEWTETEGTAKIDRLLAAYDASAFVVGHTVQKAASIRARFNDKVFLLDTGMVASSSHAGRASALEIRDNQKFTAIYLDGQTVLFERGAAVPH
jgi:Calcineurin-like phosphoesterase